MKKYLYSILTVMVAATLAGCSNDDDELYVQPSAKGTMTDDQGNEYGWVRIGNLDWTTSNAKNGTPFYGHIYEDNGYRYYTFLSSLQPTLRDEYMPEYGNLMMYDDAIASAPAGWRVPTDDDWKDLERALGIKDADATGWRNGASALMQQGDEGTGLHLQLGGGIMRADISSATLKDMHFKEMGYYWSSTPDPQSSVEGDVVFFRRLTFGHDAVDRGSCSVQRYMSVRWVRDAR